MSDWDYIKENYIDKGLKIFPIQKNGKTPMINSWQIDCSCDYFQVLYWYTNCKDCNWGLPCTQNNLFVLDLDRHDPEKDGVENFGKILDKIFTDDDYDNFATCTQITPSGGEHIIFQSDDELKNVANGSNVFKDYPGIDIRTDGYIVVSPSSINGKKYGFATVGECDPQIMHRKLKKFVLENTTLKNDSKKEPYKKPTSVECGDRDNQLFSYINNIYFKTSLDYDEILVLAKHFNDNTLEEPFPERTVEYKVKKVFEKDRSKYIHIRLEEE